MYVGIIKYFSGSTFQLLSRRFISRWKILNSLFSGNTDRNLRFPRSNLKSLFDLDSFVLGINLKWEI